MKESNEILHGMLPREMCLVASKRVTDIAKEFTEGFEFLEGIKDSVTFFGGGRFGEDSKYYKDARTLAGRIAKELDFAVISGGGPGVMEAANRGAYEVGGESLGLLINLPEAQRSNGYVTHSIGFHYFFVRKVCLAFSAEAFVFYPGGFGTSDEFFEILTLIQTKKVKGVPMICVGSDYWNSIKDLMDKEMLKRGSVDKEDMGLFHILDDHDKIIEIIKNTKKSP